MDSVKLEMFLHVTAVIVGLGVLFALPFLQAFAERNGVAATRLMLRFAQRLENVVVIPGAILVLIFGGMLVGNSDLPYKDDMPAWLVVSMIWFIVAYGAGLFLLWRDLKAAIGALEGVADSGTLPDAYSFFGNRMQVVTGLLGLSVVAIAFLMVWKPGD